MLRQAAVSSCPGLTLTWEDDPVDYYAMSIVVPGINAPSVEQFHVLTQEQCGVIYALRSVCELIALPNDFTDRDWNDLQTCGSLAVAGAEASYTLFRNRPNEQDSE